MKSSVPTLFIDFDSTFCQVESLDLLIEQCIDDEVKRQEVLSEIEKITNLGMSGKLDYMDSLKQRIQLLEATRQDVHHLVEQLHALITPSIKANQSFFQQHKDSIYIISNGFKDFIVPVVEQFGLHGNQVFANEFVYDEDDQMIGVDTTNPLSRNAGKPKVINSLQLNGSVVMIGDGYNDYQVKKAGACDLFIVLTENVYRESVVPLADKTAATFDEIINQLNL